MVFEVFTKCSFYANGRKFEYSYEDGVSVFKYADAEIRTPISIAEDVYEFIREQSQELKDGKDFENWWRSLAKDEAKSNEDVLESSNIQKDVIPYSSLEGQFNEVELLLTGSKSTITVGHRWRAVDYSVQKSVEGASIKFVVKIEGVVIGKYDSYGRVKSLIQSRLYRKGYGPDYTKYSLEEPVIIEETEIRTKASVK